MGSLCGCWRSRFWISPSSAPSAPWAWSPSELPCRTRPAWWASSSGCDAQPYFRIFHPVTQSRRFDPQGRFIRRYLPGLAALPDAALHAPWEASPLELQAAGVVLGRDYPLPIVDHATARERTLQRYAVVKTVER